MSETNPAVAAEVVAPHRYTAAMAADIEARLAGLLGRRGHLRGPEPER
ncbi:hypothetical protein ACRAWF_28870 [Streptomyces sp. L7]